MTLTKEQKYIILNKMEQAKVIIELENGEASLRSIDNVTEEEALFAQEVVINVNKIALLIESINRLKRLISKNSSTFVFDKTIDKKYKDKMAGKFTEVLEHLQMMVDNDLMLENNYLDFCNASKEAYDDYRKTGTDNAMEIVENFYERDRHRMMVLKLIFEGVVEYKTGNTQLNDILNDISEATVVHKYLVDFIRIPNKQFDVDEINRIMEDVIASQ